LKLNEDLTFEIKKWDVINLCEDKVICCHMIENKQCDKEARYCKNNIYLCKSHTKNKPFLIPPANLSEKSLSKSKLDDLLTLCKEYNIEVNEKKVTKNLLLEKINAMIEEKYFNNIKTVRADDVDLIKIGISMKNKLDNIINVNEIDTIIIENQISPIANRMKTLQGMISQYFIMNNVYDIIFYSASNKLKQFTSTKNTTYNERKQLGVMYVNEIFNNYPEINSWKEYFFKHKKKDDLADSFLQGLSYFNQKSNLTIKLDNF
jgi:hypothetical protein